MGNDFAGAATEVRVGQVAAICPSCRVSSLFLRAKRTRLSKADSRVCAGCGAEHFYTALLEQIAHRTMTEAERLLTVARSSRKKT